MLVMCGPDQQCRQCRTRHLGVYVRSGRRLLCWRKYRKPAAVDKYWMAAYRRYVLDACNHDRVKFWPPTLSPESLPLWRGRGV